MTEKQGRVCVFLSAGALAVSILTLSFHIAFAIEHQRELAERDTRMVEKVTQLRAWSISIQSWLEAGQGERCGGVSDEGAGGVGGPVQRTIPAVPTD